MDERISESEVIIECLSIKEFGMERITIMIITIIDIVPQKKAIKTLSFLRMSCPLAVLWSSFSASFLS